MVDSIYASTTEGYFVQDRIEMTLPGVTNFGFYDIWVNVTSDYYSGTLLLEKVLEVVPPPPILELILIIASTVGLGIGLFVQKTKRSAKRSITGAILMNMGGTIVEETLSTSAARMNASLVSGAVSGLTTLMREITGGSVRTIKIDTGYMDLNKGVSFWVIIFLRNDPSQIRRTIRKFVRNIETEYGEQIKNWNGIVENIPIPFRDLLKKWFGKPTQLHASQKETRQPASFDLQKQENHETKIEN